MITYHVKLAHKKHPDVVKADYFKVDQGVITFRCLSNTADHGYPLFVKCYAAGAWLSVENANGET